MVKNLPANAGDVRDMGSTPVLGRSPGEGNGNPLQYSCLENLMDREAWWPIVHVITVMPKSRNLPMTTREPLSDAKSAKKESFYYQARAGAPTDTDAAAIGRSPELWVTLVI